MMADTSYASLQSLQHRRTPTPRISSLPNLRLLCSFTSNYERKGPFHNTAIFRSAKPDRITQEDLSEFRNLGIKCIIDFRSKEEYFGTDGQRLLDKEYILHKLIPPKKVGQSMKVERIDLNKTGHSHAQNGKEPVARSESDDSGSLILDHDGGEKKHFLINFFTPCFIIKSVSRLPFYLYCVGIFHFLCDFIRRDFTFKHFSTFFTQNVINRIGIKGQYMDITELCQPQICSVLKLISDSQNLPVLLNCAHGKDRTGIVSALLLTCLGLPKEDIALEYQLSKEGLAPINHLVRKDLIEKYRLKEEFVTAEADTMRFLLDHLEKKYGSVEDYMEAIGFSREEQASLRSRLVFSGSISRHDREDCIENMDDPGKSPETTTPQPRVRK